MPLWKTTITILHYLIYPFIVLARWLLVLLGFLAAPLLLVGHYIVVALLLPFRILAKFETLYIFFGVAAIVGLVTGIFLHFSSSFMVHLLGLERRDEPKKPSGHTAASYRAAREKKRQERLYKAAQQRNILPRPLDGEILKREYSEWLEQDRGRPKDGLLATTILEEEDDSDGVFL